MLLQFLIYLLIMLISNQNVTLLDVTIRPRWSLWIKLTMRSVLGFLKEQLRFATCLLDANMNLFALSILMGMIICFLDRLLVVMFILGLSLSTLPNIVLLIFSIFLFESSEKFFMILLIFFEETCAYKGLLFSMAFWFLLDAFLPWNLDFSRTFFEGLRGS